MNGFNVGLWMAFMATMFYSMIYERELGPVFWVWFITLCFLLSIMVSWYKPKARKTKWKP